MKLPRWFAHLVANVGGYFWMPCPKCGRMFGGFEPHGGMMTTVQAGTGYVLRRQVLCAQCPHDEWRITLQGWYIKDAFWEKG